jgi:benzoate transport
MTTGVSTDVRAQMRGGEMSAFQVIAVTICMIINMLDGFDVLAIAFTGPRIAEEWGLSPTDLGLLFSAGVAGMGAGSLFLSPLADVIGRRGTVLIGLATISGGMLASAYTADLWQLGAMRFVTGLGIGMLLSSINTIVVEFSSARRRDFSVAIMAIGYPIGATIGGVIAIWLIHKFGWPSVFIFGGILSTVMIPVVIWLLPESLDFLLVKRPRNALARVNTVLARLGRPRLAALPDAVDDKESKQRSVLSLFDRDLLWRTALICTAYFLVMLSFYFVLNWTPKVLVDQGLSLGAGISGAIFLNAGGIVGGLILGWYTRKFGLLRLAGLYMFLIFASMAAFGLIDDNLTLMLIVAFVMGFFMIGSIVSLYAIIGAAYPTRIRNSGTGLALGIGRIGAIAGPYLGGVLIAGGWDKWEYCLALGIPAALAGLVILFLPLKGAALPEVKA